MLYFRYLYFFATYPMLQTLQRLSLTIPVSIISTNVRIRWYHDKYGKAHSCHCPLPTPSYISKLPLSGVICCYIMAKSTNKGRGYSWASQYLPLLWSSSWRSKRQRSLSQPLKSVNTGIGQRYVDNVIAVVNKGQAQFLPDHMNSVDVSGNINWMRKEEKDKSLPFLDTRKEDDTIKSIVFRKQTHTE